MQCTITTPESLVHSGEARLVVVPASDGELGILPRHAPLMALLGSGELRVSVPGGKTASFFVDGGFVQVIDDRVTVLATRAEASAAIPAAEARAALERLRAEPEAGLDVDARADKQKRLRAAELRARLAGKV